MIRVRVPTGVPFLGVQFLAGVPAIMCKEKELTKEDLIVALAIILFACVMTYFFGDPTPGVDWVTWWMFL